ncbi:MAG: hypothetical protein KDA74_13205, partial [Planctomycetaceae bacterium]|nr:hypothetical protein [Planctomycetaceae bacterium]
MSYLARFISVSLGLVLLFLFCAGGTCDSVYAQSTQPEISSQQPGNERKSEAPLIPDRMTQPPVSGNVVVPQPTDGEFKQNINGTAKQDVYIKGEDGQYFPLPNLSLDQILEYLKQKQDTQVERSPAYAVSSISLDGTIKEDRAVLDVRIVVLINEEKQWIRVPIKLNESIFLKTSYKGEGESSPGGFNRTEGYLWWFQGKGTHELNLTVSVSLKQQLPSRRLQLVLPQTAVSNLKLTIPLPQVSLEVPTGVAVSKKAISNDQSLVEMFGLGDQLDLSWQPIPDE